MQSSPQYSKRYLFSFVDTGTKSTIIVYDRITYVDDPDSDGSLGSGSSLASASTHECSKGTDIMLPV